MIGSVNVLIVGGSRNPVTESPQPCSGVLPNEDYRNRLTEDPGKWGTDRL